jgi:hypothetical protein
METKRHVDLLTFESYILKWTKLKKCSGKLQCLNINTNSFIRFLYFCVVYNTNGVVCIEIFTFVVYIIGYVIFYYYRLTVKFKNI